MGNQCFGGGLAREDDTAWNARSSSPAHLDWLQRPHAKSTPLESLRRDEDARVRQVNQYTMLRPLGRGSFGDVYLASDRADQYAVKVLKKSALRRQRQGRFGSALDAVRAEVALMKRIRHPHCVSMVEVVDDERAEEIFIVLEYADGGVSQPHGRDGRPLRLREGTIWAYTRQLLLGLEFLHGCGIMHRDIKPDNLLVSRGGAKLQIADFGTAASVEVSEDASRRTAGTPAFFAPEACEPDRAGRYDGRACDLWALGVTLHLWTYGSAPFWAETPMLVMEQIQACPPVVALPSVGPARQPSAELRRVLRALLTRSVAHRMSLNALRLDPWLTKQHTAPLAAQPSLRAPAPPQAAAAPAAASPVEQVSGHAGALARAGQTVLAKASTAAEFSFYAAIASSDLALHVPILYGRRRSNGAPTGSPPAAGSGACVLLVQDITEGMGAPCLMDVKMGSRTVLDAELADGTLRADLLKKMDLIDPTEAKPGERAAGGVSKARYLAFRDQRTSSGTLGFRIDAAVLSAPGSGQSAPLDFDLRSVRHETSVRACLAAFLGRSRALCRAVLAKLERLRAACERSPFFERAVLLRSSILISYDAERLAQLPRGLAAASADDLLLLAAPPAVQLKLIDFAQCSLLPVGSALSHRAAWAPGSSEDGYLTGVDSLIRLLEAVHASLPS